MLWTNITGDSFVVTVMVPKVFKVIAAAYFNLLKEVLNPWLDHLTLSLLRILVFMHGKTVSHSARVTQLSLGMQGEKLMVWSAASTDFNPIENIWSIVKPDDFGDGRQFTLKDLSCVTLKLQQRQSYILR